MKLTRKVLLNRARPVDFKYPRKNQILAQDLLSLMRTSGGIGLAAPQCGISRRVFVMQIQDRAWSCFNPEIQAHSHDFVDYDEGCLSFPGEHCIVSRPSWVNVRYQDHQGDWHSERLDDLPARCFQHEYDHLDGVTMWQRQKEQNAKQP